ncbi:NAD(P)H-binding protein [Saccharomonospora sp. NPDC046836]|uniref:NAD(P)H-binding protein n=1 Tax=Saccharomonospora sp. NPDC046836 TaxID=3156921 RepID=UPI0033F875D5
MREVLVIGATGTTGSRVAAGLTERGVPVRLATRTPRAPGHIRFEWADTNTHRLALKGVDAVYLIAPIGVADPVPVVEPLLHEAVESGVRRVVLLSSSAVTDQTPGLGALPRLVRTASPEWTVLRPSWFMNNFTGDHPVAQGVRAGEIVTATGSGRVGFVDAEDIAAVAVRALTDERPHNTDHLITGPQALNYTEAAAIITDVTGQPVIHRAVDVPELLERLSAYPPEFAAILAALDADIAAGAEDRVTDTVARVTGRPAREFRTFIRKELR